LIVGDHLGKTTSLWFGFKCPNDITRTASPCLPGPGSVVHQTALYDLVLSSVLLVVLLWLRRHRPHYDGFLISLFGLWYGCQRILEDFLREDKHIIGHAAPGVGLTGSQVTAIITVLVCLWHLVFVRRTPRWGNWDQVPEEEQPAGEDAGVAGDEHAANERGPEESMEEPAQSVGAEKEGDATSMPGEAVEKVEVEVVDEE
jgi:hypothetical protein